MRTIFRHLPCLVIAVGLLGSVARAGEPDPIRVTITPERTHQTFEGWGFAGAWWSHHVGGWPGEVRGRILDLLYTDKGADLTIFRYNPGAGLSDEIEDPWRTKRTFETAPGEYDWGRDPNGIRVLREALDRGVEEVVFCYYSPPARLTVSGMPSGGPEGTSNIEPASFGAFARYCVDIAEHWREELGLETLTVSPLNEPQWPWGRDNRNQEGMFLTPDETVGLLRAVAEEIRRRDAPLRLEGPEAGEWSRSTEPYIRAIAADPVVRGSLHRLAVHSYWSDAAHRTELRELLSELGLDIPIAMTEWCHMEWGKDASMASALVLADTIHTDLTLGGVVSWSGWLAVGPYDFKSGLVYVDKQTRAVEETKRLWVTAQFSRFIRPGSVRIGCEVDGERIRAVSFDQPGDGPLVCVLINPTPEPARVGFGPGFAVLDAHTTHADSDFEPITSVADTVRVEGRSVTTVRLDRPEDDGPTR